MSNIANSSEGIPCSRYKELRPYKDRKALDKECIISFTPSSKQYFTYKVMKYKFKFVPIHLRFLNLSSQTEIHYTRCVIQPMDWIWTFRGVEGNYGGRQYLTWPPEYGTLSIGMLKAHTSIPLHMNLTVQALFSWRELQYLHIRGLFANPSYTEGYLIFSITVTMYLYDSTNSINETYERLFNQTKKVCKRLNSQLEEDYSVILHIKDIEGARIPLELYMFVVDAQKPKRVEILKSFLKITTIFLCLYISVGILTRFDGFQQLSVVTQTATTTFVCLVPKIFTRMCTLNERREILQMRSKIHKHVEHFLLYKGVECGGLKSKNGTENA
ncbi:Hypothetical predicted protein [Mytilus galloprovincialis]|uniref:Uncharacterized protein n=1 Tax=Mytilus galloprovincialis TaxID=29158 RepID=A0A8B6D6V8_MYTGA|nr:Hypothetical predicted protein [Mytilus galloprovincialis]